jgi:hypothetical protein
MAALRGGHPGQQASAFWILRLDGRVKPGHDIGSRLEPISRRNWRKLLYSRLPKLSLNKTISEKAASRGFFFVFGALREIIVETIQEMPCLRGSGIATISSRKDSCQ